MTSNGDILWNFGPGWSNPSGIGGLPGNGDLQAQVNYRVGDILVQGFWRGNQGWTRNVPIVHDVVQWSSAPPFGGPLNINELPGSGDMQAHGDYAAGSTIIQAIWRSNQGYARNVPIVNGVPQWHQASAWNWNNPISINGLPGSGDMQAQDNFAIYDKYYQTIWRGDHQYRRWVPIVHNVVDFGQAQQWELGTYQENVPGSGSVQAQGNYTIDWRADINPDYRRGEIRVVKANFGVSHNWYGYAHMFFVNQNGTTYYCYSYPYIIYNLDCVPRRVDSGLIRINTYWGSPPPDHYLARHELGHVFGRGHPACSPPITVMYEPSCNNFQTTLTPSDVAWINANY